MTRYFSANFERRCHTMGWFGVLRRINSATEDDFVLTLRLSWPLHLSGFLGELFPSVRDLVALVREIDASMVHEPDAAPHSSYPTLLLRSATAVRRHNYSGLDKHHDILTSLRSFSWTPSDLISTRKEGQKWVQVWAWNFQQIFKDTWSFDLDLIQLYSAEECYTFLLLAEQIGPTRARYLLSLLPPKEAHCDKAS